MLLNETDKKELISVLTTYYNQLVDSSLKLKKIIKRLQNNGAGPNT